jgi:RimJ/RimL family protein N-acetyltransferase
MREPLAHMRKLVLPPEPVEIAAGWLQLTPWTGDLAPEIVELISDPEFRRWYVHPPELGADAAERFIRSRAERWRSGDLLSLAVRDATTGGLVGDVQLSDLSPWDGSAWIGYSTAPAARGRGVAPHAVGVLTRWGFEALGLHRIQLGHAVENPASCRVAIKAGYRAEGILRSSLPRSTGGWWDMEVHAVINPADS